MQLLRFFSFGLISNGCYRSPGSALKLHINNCRPCDTSYYLGKFVRFESWFIPFFSVVQSTVPILWGLLGQFSPQSPISTLGTACGGCQPELDWVQLKQQTGSGIGLGGFNLKTGEGGSRVGTARLELQCGSPLATCDNWPLTKPLHLVLDWVSSMSCWPDWSLGMPAQHLFGQVTPQLLCPAIMPLHLGRDL